MKYLFLIIVTLVIGYASGQALKMRPAYGCSCVGYELDEWSLKLISVKSSKLNSEYISSESAQWSKGPSITKLPKGVWLRLEDENVNQ
jgi:hypothetical protein